MILLRTLVIISTAAFMAKSLSGCGKVTEEAENLLGTWRSDCYQVDDQTAQASSKIQDLSASILSHRNYFYFEKSKAKDDARWQFTHTILSYSDSSCDENNVTEAKSETGHYAIETRRYRKGLRHRLRLKVLRSTESQDRIAGRPELDLSPVIIVDGAPSLDQIKKSTYALRAPRRRQASYRLNTARADERLQVFGQSYVRLGKSTDIEPVQSPSPSPSQSPSMASEVND